MFNYLKNILSLLSDSFKKKTPILVLSYLLISLLESMGIAIIFPVIALVVNPTSIESFSIYHKIRLLLPSGILTNLTTILPLIMIFTFVLKSLATIFISKYQIYITNTATNALSVDLFQRYLNMPFLESLSRDTGFMNYTILSAGNILYNSCVTPLLQLVAEIITVSILLVLLLAIDIQTALMVLGMNILFGGTVYLLTKNKLKSIGQENRYYSEKLVRNIREAFSNFKEFKILNCEAFFKRRFTESRDKNNINQSLQMTLIMLNRNIIEILFFISISVMAYIVISNNLKVIALAKLGVYGLVAIRLIPSATRIFTSLQTMKTAEGAIDLLINEKTYFPYEQPFKNEPSKKVRNGHIAFKDVSFCYPAAPKPALNHINLDIKPNSIIGIVGRTGSGKTTLVDLILNLIQPTSGTIFVDGQPLTAVASDWKKHLAYVPQRITFMDGTLIQNIAYGISELEIDFDRIQKVITTAQLEQDLLSFENGLNTIVKEEGNNLSGGQKQRIGIARALYRQPKILILDEATSALDVQTESKISEVIHQAKNNCTVIIIAHRLSTIRNCDKIYYIDDGYIIADGTFDELAKENDNFAYLVRLSNFSHHPEIC